MQRDSLAIQWPQPWRSILVECSTRLDTGLVSAISSGAKTGSAHLRPGGVAGGSLAGRVAPVELISIYGSATFDADGFLPTILGGIQVMIDGTPAPVLNVSVTQINAVVPLKLSTTSPTSFVTVTTNGTSLLAVPSNGRFG